MCTHSQWSITINDSKNRLSSGRFSNCFWNSIVLYLELMSFTHWNNCIASYSEHSKWWEIIGSLMPGELLLQQKCNRFVASWTIYCVPMISFGWKHGSICPAKTVRQSINAVASAQNLRIEQVRKCYVLGRQTLWWYNVEIYDLYHPNHNHKNPTHFSRKISRSAGDPMLATSRIRSKSMVAYECWSWSAAISMAVWVSLSTPARSHLFLIIALILFTTGGDDKVFASFINGIISVAHIRSCWVWMK